LPESAGTAGLVENRECRHSGDSCSCAGADTGFRLPESAGTGIKFRENLSMPYERQEGAFRNLTLEELDQLGIGPYHGGSLQEADG